MTYIVPDGIVQFYSDLGIDPSYENTLYFASRSAKDTHFDDITPLATCQALTYSRAERGFIRVEQSMALMVRAGYMRFKNTSFESKWFYAFIKNVEYINNNTVQVNFELDVMMTWMGEFNLNQCFVERQHTLGDAVGANIAEEGLALGNFVTEHEEMFPPTNYVIMLYKTYNRLKDESDPNNPTLAPDTVITQGTYVPIISFAYPLDVTNLGLLQGFLNDLTEDNRIDEVLGLKLVPEEWTTTGTNVPHRANNISIAKPYQNIGGSTYAPKNNKLYTYPFKYLEVDNCEGQKTVYKYEYFNQLPDNPSQGSCTFDVFGTACTPEVDVMCVPLSYNGEPHAYDESISMKDFPSLAWNVDAYKAYLAQRDSTIFGSFISSTLAGVVTGGLTGGGAGALLGGAIGATHGAKPVISDFINEIASDPNKLNGLRETLGNDSLVVGVLNSLSVDTPSRMPNETRGSLSSNLMVQTRNKGFYFRCKSITKNYAIMIDNFFDMYGYAVKQHLIPVMNARPHWTYVKTQGCSLNGELPADHASIIEKIFDKGVRFWKTHTEIGNYSLPNAPV